LLPCYFVYHILTTDSVAQEANFELAERFTADKMQKMTGSTFLSPNWIEDENRFWYEWETPDGKQWMFVDADDETARPLFDRDDMAAQLSEEFSRGFNARDLEIEDFDFDTERGFFTFHVDSVEFKYHVDQNNLVKGDSLDADTEEGWETFSPDSTYIAFAREHDLYIMETDDPDSTEIRLTEDGERWYSFQADHGDTTSTERLRANE